MASYVYLGKFSGQLNISNSSHGTGCLIKFMVPDALRSSYLCLILLFHSTVVLDACLHGTRGTL